METMNYDKIKGKSNAPLVAFVMFIVLGAAIVAYAMINEKKPEIIGENALVNVSSNNVVDEKKEIEYSVKSVSRTDNKSSYKSNIVLPEISVDGTQLTDVNEQIKKKFLDKYDALGQEAAGNLENTFTYKVIYKSYEVEVKEKKILSIVLNETITAGKNQVFSNKKYGYTIDLEEKKILSSDEAAPLILDYSYRNKIKEQVKDYIIGNNIVKESEYNYAFTGMEEYYITGNEFHIIFNPSEPFNEKAGIIDIKVEK